MICYADCSLKWNSCVRRRHSSFEVHRMRFIGCFFVCSPFFSRWSSNVLADERDQYVHLSFFTAEELRRTNLRAFLSRCSSTRVRIPWRRSSLVHSSAKDGRRRSSSSWSLSVVLERMFFVLISNVVLVSTSSTPWRSVRLLFRVLSGDEQSSRLSIEESLCQSIGCGQCRSIFVSRRNGRNVCVNRIFRHEHRFSNDKWTNSECLFVVQERNLVNLWDFPLL